MTEKKKIPSRLLSIMVPVMIFLIIIVAPVVTLMNIKNTAVRFENQIVKLDKASEVSLSNHTNTILEMVQIPKMQTDHLVRLAKEALSARYGEDGSKALFQFIKENTAAPSEKLYLDLQATIAGGRRDFKLSQEVKLENCTQYDTWRETWPTSMGVSFFDLPSKKVEGRCEIITDDTTRNSFETKRTAPIQLN